MSVLKRPDFTNSIFLGVQGIENNEKLVKLVDEAFPEHTLHVMDKEMFNTNVENTIKKFIKWQENQGVLGFTSKPQHIQKAIETSLNIKKAVGEGWFSMTDLVEKTNFTYAQAKQVIDLQYAFGLLAMDETEKVTKYKSISSLEEQIDHIQSIRNSMEKEMTELDVMLEKMKADKEEK